MADTRDKVGRAGVFLAGGVLKAEKIVEQAKARLAEAKRKASQQKRKEENQHISLATMCLTSRL